LLVFSDPEVVLTHSFVVTKAERLSFYAFFESWFVLSF